jgi:hypothetical protein
MAEQYPSLQELQDKQDRQNNLVVHGISESESDIADTRKMHDKVHFEEICREGLEIDHSIIKITRLGAKKRRKTTTLTGRDGRQKRETWYECSG